jgi:hypothetical protein
LPVETDLLWHDKLNRTSPCQGSYHSLSEVVILEQAVEIASRAPTAGAEPAIFVCGRCCKSARASLLTLSYCHCTPYVNLVDLKVLPMHVLKEASYGRQIHLNAAL